MRSIEGVYSVKTNFNNREVVITFDEQQVSVDHLKQVLAENHFPVRGQVMYLE